MTDIYDPELGGDEQREKDRLILVQAKIRARCLGDVEWVGQDEQTPVGDGVYITHAIGHFHNGPFHSTRGKIRLNSHAVYETVINAARVQAAATRRIEWLEAQLASKAAQS